MQMAHLKIDTLRSAGRTPCPPAAVQALEPETLIPVSPAGRDAMAARQSLSVWWWGSLPHGRPGGGQSG
jgi:hypothetical protein